MIGWLKSIFVREDCGPTRWPDASPRPLRLVLPGATLAEELRDFRAKDERSKRLAALLQFKKPTSAKVVSIDSARRAK